MSDIDTVGFFTSSFRALFAKVDLFIYNLIAGLYQIFLSVANADIISPQTMKDFYGRVQLILGIIIMFKVAMSLFNGIMNPNSLRNEKTGVSSMIKRIVVVLVMLLLLIPLNIPSSDTVDISNNDETGNSQKSWNARMNYNGILFGTLFELQDRILDQNTISRLLLGNDNSNEDSSNDNETETGYELANLILKCFVNINVLTDGIDPSDDDNRVCSETLSDEISDAYDYYEFNNISPTVILSRVNLTCSIDDETWGQKIGKFASTLAGGVVGGVAAGPIGAIVGAFGANKAANAVVSYQNGEYYAFYYAYIFSTVVGVFVALIIISFTIDVAIRVFKLAILKLIAPVPIISYIDPKTEGAFHNWLKTLGLTYANVFVRLTIINFVIFFIKEFAQNGTGVRVTGDYGVVRIFSNLFVYLGLLMFAKEAPKFIFDTLGIKKTQGLFSGLAGLAGGISSARNAFRAAYTADKENKGKDENSKFNRAKQLMAGIVSGVGGAGSAYKDYVSANDNKWRTSLDRVNRENAWRMSNAEAGGSWWGRTKASLQQDWGGDTDYDRLKREQEHWKDQKKELERSNGVQKNIVDKMGKLKTAGEEKAFDKNARIKIGDCDVGLRDIETAAAAAQSRGDKTFKYLAKLNGDEVTNTMNLEYYLAHQKEFKEAGGREYIQHSYKYNGDGSFKDDNVDQGISNLAESAGFNIDINQSEKDFAHDFKKKKVDALNIIHDNEMNNVKYRYVDDNGNVSFGIQAIDNALYDIEEKMKRASANLRGNDGSRGGS